MPWTRFALDGSAWRGLSPYPVTYVASNSGIISAGEFLDYNGVVGAAGGPSINTLRNLDNRVVGASYGSQNLVGVGAETHLVFDFVRSNNGALDYTIEIPLPTVGGNRTGTLFNMTLSFNAGLTPRCIFQGGLVDPTVQMRAANLTLMFVPIINFNFDPTTITGVSE